MTAATLDIPQELASYASDSDDEAMEPVPDADALLGDGDPEEAITARQVLAVGRRPQDFATRDFLLAGPFADPRMRILWRQLRDVQPAITEMISQLPRAMDCGPGTQDMAKHACNVLVYIFHHFTWLHGLFDALELDDDWRLATRLWNCPPVGVQFELPRDRDDNSGRPCKMPRLCPYCLTRQAIGLWRRLQQQLVLDEPDGRSLLLIRAATNDMCFAENDPLQMAGPDAADHVRQHVSAALRAHAEELGAIGGATFFQMSPRKFPFSAGTWYRPSIGEYAFEYHTSVLAEIPGSCETVDDLLPCLEASDVGVPVRYTVQCVPASLTNLRALLLGTSRRSTLNPDGWQPGAIINPCWSLFQVTDATDDQVVPCADQWQLYRLAIKDVPLYRKFGSWDGHQSTLQAANRQRHVESVQHLEAAIDTGFQTAQSVYQRLCCQRGTAPGRVRFRRALSEAGLTLPDRTVRLLLRRLETHPEHSTSTTATALTA